MKPIIIPIVIALGLLISGCTTTPQVIRQIEYRTVEFPHSLNRCRLTPLPNSSTLTEGQVSTLLLQMSRGNAECRNSLRKIVQYYEEANRRIRSSNEAVR